MTRPHRLAAVDAARDDRGMPGQTKSEIRALLAAADLSPQHRFGQNFLVDLNLMRKLVASAEIAPTDTVLEVGAGTGSLTELLLEAGAHIVAVEIDRGFQRLLRERLGEEDRLKLIQGDALEGKHRVNALVLKVLGENPPRHDGAYKLVANLPYQIATPLVVDLLMTTPRFERLCCTIQKEVGERLAAVPNTREYGPVSVIMQTLALVHPVAILPPAAFWPRPQVESVMLEIRPVAPEEAGVGDDPRDFAHFVQHGFQQRRKMMRRLLREWSTSGVAGMDESTAWLTFQQAGVNPDARPAELAPDVWRRLYLAVRRRQQR